AEDGIRDRNVTGVQTCALPIFTNAAKAGPGGRIEVRAAAEDGTVTLAVQDHGCGIPADHLDRVTEPFYMVDKSRARRQGGSGLRSEERRVGNGWGRRRGRVVPR